MPRVAEGPRSATPIRCNWPIKRSVRQHWPVPCLNRAAMVWPVDRIRASASRVLAVHVRSACPSPSASACAMRVSAPRWVLARPFHIEWTHLAIPTILPNECYAHSVNNDFTRNVNYNGSTSYCDQNEFASGRWIRFSGEAGSQLSSNMVANGRCGTYYTSYLNGTHPTRLGERKTATVCYNYYSSCYWQNSIMITKCGDYFVYYLTQPPTCNLRYCTV